MNKNVFVFSSVHEMSPFFFVFLKSSIFNFLPRLSFHLDVFCNTVPEPHVNVNTVRGECIK
jgi:hypothetical protein